MNEPSRPAVSTYMLLILSPLLTLGSLIAYSLSSVRNTFDFLVPVVGIAQLVFVIGLFLGSLWGLIGYSVIVIGLCLATLLYYVPKGETNAALKTLAFMLPFVLLATYYWTVKRSWFK